MTDFYRAHAPGRVPGMLGYRLPAHMIVADADDPAAPTVLLVHGFGCDRNMMLSAFRSRALAGYHLVAVELPGHDSTPPLDDPGDTDLLGHMGGLVQHVAASVRPPESTVVHVVAHSAALPVVAASGVTVMREMGRLIGIEGNLVPEDCTVTRDVAAQAPQVWQREGHQALISRLGNLAGAERQWSWSLMRADKATLHQFATEVVAACDSPVLRLWWRQQPHRSWFYGQRSGLPAHLEPLMKDVLTVPVPDAGHFPMLDNPGDLWGGISQHLALAPFGKD